MKSMRLRPRHRDSLLTLEGKQLGVTPTGTTQLGPIKQRDSHLIATMRVGLALKFPGWTGQYVLALEESGLLLFLPS